MYGSDYEGCVIFSIAAGLCLMFGIGLYSSFNEPHAKLSREVYRLRQKKEMIKLEREKVELQKYLDEEAKKTPEAK